MTEWIDRLESSLSDEERNKNRARAVRLRTEQIITTESPRFFDAITKEAQHQATELDAQLGDTLGEVLFDASPDRFILKTNKPYPMVIEVSLNLSARNITVHRASENAGEPPTDDRFELAAGEGRIVYAKRGEAQFDTAEAFVSQVLEETFARELLTK
jgi:hypothetical protein